jgi:hypothetical protein
MIVNRDDGFKKYLARHPKRTITFEREPTGDLNLIVTMESGRAIRVPVGALLPE